MVRESDVFGRKAKGPVSVDGEISDVHNQIGATKKSIDVLERQYRENIVSIKIHQKPHACFSADVPTSFSENDTDDLILRARKELELVVAQNVEVEKQKLKKYQEIQESLRKQITETKNKFRYLDALHQDGPKFLFNLTSSFGPNFKTDIIADQIMLLVTLSGAIELWNIENVSQATMFDYVSVPISSDDRVTVFQTLRRNETFVEEEPTQAEVEETQPKKFWIHQQYFIGTAAGRMIIVEVSVRTGFEADLKCQHRVLLSQLISSLPIQACAYARFMGAYITSCTLHGAGSFLIAFNEQTHDGIWQLDIDSIETIRKQKTKIGVSSFNLSFENMGETAAQDNLNIPPVTCIFADTYQSSILVALRNGIVVRVSSDHRVNSGALSTTHEAHGQIESREELAGLVVTPCIDILSQVKSDPRCVVAQEIVEIVDICGFFNISSKKPQVVFCCSDGTLRCYNVEPHTLAQPITFGPPPKELDPYETEVSKAKASTNAADVKKTLHKSFFTMKDESHKIALVGNASAQFAICYSVDGTLYIYDTSDFNLLIELAVLLNRKASRPSRPKTGSQSRGAKREIRRSLDVVGDRKILIAASSGTDCAVMSLQDFKTHVTC
ncbi:hypothetical protein BJ742DRAFT_864475 [Cladochytrium replicatum]|nr:hypothetical protein BJ742DRAFT_864475 [Cladochytrium replicatum]